MRTQVRSLASLNGLWIWCCREMCRSQTWLRSGVAMAVMYSGSYRSNWTPGLGTSMCHCCGPKKTKKKKKEKQRQLTGAVLSALRFLGMWYFCENSLPRGRGSDPRSPAIPCVTGCFSLLVVSALNKAWCVSCFACSTCNTKLTLK